MVIYLVEKYSQYFVINIDKVRKKLMEYYIDTKS